VPIAPPLIAPSVRPLTTVHRQKAGSGIVDLATAIRGGRTDEVIDMLQSSESPDLCWVDTAAIDGSSAVSAASVHAVAPSPREPVRQPTLFEVGLGAAEADPEQQREHRRRLEAVRSEMWSVALDAVQAAGEANEAASLT